MCDLGIDGIVNALGIWLMRNVAVVATVETRLHTDGRLLDFWGPVSNFGIPVAAVLDTQKSPDLYVMVRYDEFVEA